MFRDGRVYSPHILRAPDKVFEVIGKELYYLLPKVGLHFLADLNLLIWVVRMYGHHVQVEAQVIDVRVVDIGVVDIGFGMFTDSCDGSDVFD